MLGDTIKYSDQILRQILGRDMFRELVESVPNILDKRIGKNHSTIEGIIITKLLSKFVLLIGIAMANGYTYSQIEMIVSPTYKVYIHFESIQDIYVTFKKYIDKVIEFVK